MNIKRIKKYSAMGYRKMRSYFTAKFFVATGFMMPKPMRVYYLMSNKCNYQCKMCPQWKSGLKESVNDYISTERMKEVIDEMVLNGIKEFGVSGGEPLIFKDKMFELLRYANNKGIYTHFVSNGKLLTKGVLAEYNKIGGGHVSLSIDADSKKHDELRGYEGAYDEIKRVLQIFQDNKFPNIVLKINAVISNDNLEDISQVVELSVKAKALLFIQPFDTYTYGDRNIGKKRKNFPLWVQKENVEKLKEITNKLLDLKDKYPAIVLNDRENIKDFVRYYTDESFSIKCYAGIDQIALDPFGQISFCRYGLIGDLRKSSLKEFLLSDKRRKVVKDSLQCQEGCMLGCMYKPGFLQFVKNGVKQFIEITR